MDKYDLIVIGAGSGGVRAARLAAAKGKRVAVVEGRALGGTCVNVGCVPKKLFVYASQFAEQFEQSRGYGWSLSEPQFDWPTLRDNKTAEIERLNGIYQLLLNNSGAEIIRGWARVAGPHHVSVALEDGSECELYGEAILLATGGQPFIPALPGAEMAVSSNEMFYLPQLPERAVVVGGGYIAVEFAGILNGLGVDTTLIYRGPKLLKIFDGELAERLAEAMQQAGIKLCLNSDVVAIHSDHGEPQCVELNDGRHIDAGLVLYATGRRAATEQLGLETTGVVLRDNGSVVVDENYTTAEPSIYAIGDIIDRLQLTPVAIREAVVLIDQLYGDGQAVLSYADIPTAIFSQPEIGTVGPSEEQAKVEFARLDVYVTEFKPMLATLGGHGGKIVMKLLVDGSSDRVIAAHMLGEHAAETIQGLAIAIKAGATKADFDSTVGIHPSAAEEWVTLREVTRHYRNGELEG